MVMYELTFGNRGNEHGTCDAMDHVEPLVPVMVIFIVVYNGHC